MKITKEQYLLLRSDDITEREYDAIIRIVSDRFGDILRYISIKLKWWDYDNCADSGDMGGDGWFDPKKYNEYDYIRFSGEFKLPEPYRYEIPIRWLWEDYEEEFKRKVQQFKLDEQKEKENNKLKRDVLKLKKEEMRKLITSKLTNEELKYVKFK